MQVFKKALRIFDITRIKLKTNFNISQLLVSNIGHIKPRYRSTLPKLFTDKKIITVDNISIIIENIIWRGRSHKSRVYNLESLCKLLS